MEEKSDSNGTAESSPDTPSEIPIVEEPPSISEVGPQDGPMKSLSGYGVGPAGIGGWLLFFIIGQLVCRPLQVLGEFGNSKTMDVSQIAKNFPLTAIAIEIERAVMILLLVFGIVVAIALLRLNDSRPVTLAKMYLIANPVSALVLTLIYLTSDLPDSNRTELISRGVLNFVLVSIVSTAWFLYFTRSTRVQATYFQPKVGDGFRSLR